MCGLSGIFRPDGKRVDPMRVQRMNDALAYRGPDAEGKSDHDGYCLGHRRLSIIDLSPAGRQPMHNEDGAIELVVNGEIYNFQELRAQLDSEHEFRSHTDSEVLIHGYERWGIEGLLQRIRGMYAFALVDRRNGAIHLARDPLGKKPLFYRYADGEIVFASSTRALAQGLERVPPVDVTAVHDLLWHLYIPGPRTIFEGVRKLQPGHALTITADGTLKDFVHWQPDFLHPSNDGDAEHWLRVVENELREAIRRRFIADVPVGVLLSGGVDSGLVTALAAQAVPHVKTYSVKTDDPSMDESRYAAAVAQKYGTEHHELHVTGDVRSSLTSLVAAMGEPLADASAANLFSIARLARESVTVVLTGDGGDELFGGYTHYWAYHQADRAGRIVPRWLRPHLRPLGALLSRGRGVVHRGGTFLNILSSPEESFARFGRLLPDDVRAGLFTEAASATLRAHDATSNYRDALPGDSSALIADRVMQAQMQTLLPDDYLTKADVATMAVALEARCPFLDVDLVNVAMKIPANVRFLNNEPKGLLRELARRHLPVHTVDRTKQGFVAPVGKWIREWTDLVDDVILGPHVERRGWFNRSALERLVAEHRRGVDRAYLLWSLIVLEIWLRIAVDGVLSAGDPI